VSEIPAEMLAVRSQLVGKYIRGAGLEIGALHSPVKLSQSVQVKYVDRMSVPDLRTHYPELAAFPLVTTDIVDDGERLSAITHCSQDFIIGCHFLEHTQDPIGTISAHLSKLKSGGTLFYAIPDKRMSFDVDRPITHWTHILADHSDGGLGSRLAHYEEWSALVNKIADPAEAAKNARRIMQIGYSIHFHVWDSNAFIEFLSRTHRYLNGSFDTIHFELNGPEVIAILRKP
jgi:hypothetical protein